MDVSIARWRLRSQYLTAPHAGSAADVVSTLLAVQAENPSQSAWAVASRTVSPDPEDLAGLLASGEVVRTHVLRPTWHYVGRAEIDWLLALTAPRIVKMTATQLTNDLELTLHDVDQLTTAVLNLLTATPDRTRDEVAAILRDQVPTLAERVTGRVVMLVMAQLELDRLVCSGRPRDGEHTYAIYQDRVGSRVDPEVFDRDEALARLALRYFTGHGPATVKDLAYWATLTVTDVRRGLDLVRDQLDCFEHDGRTFWHAPGEPPDGPGRPHGHLLQLLDEIYRGYQDSRWVLDAGSVVSRQRESMIGIALVEGQLVAGMRRTLSPSSVRFDLTPHRPLSAAQERVLEQAAGRYGDFLGRSAKLVIAG
ncbi:winged helix DNA-binding domain-containing protein [Phytoactinopolyspora halotolerans]|uniref:Winged helix DNA-binding domain-containing protein n=1 Tax=Phytoactinopolyspora halotolerans TaxID=1981512 RepID=A0A6L9SE69_9ACTN|nr:winged helix DNA-binding domain-containing protein [Phytoactinopolyspora halotolerans]NEE03329.1 winged helix DNA-binding domain-containing protein [Phytoactinopolyspora halotolerans]